MCALSRHPENNPERLKYVLIWWNVQFFWNYQPGFQNNNTDKKKCLTLKILKLMYIRNDVCTAVKTLHLFSEELDQRCSVKKVFLEISWNSQENTCARVSFLIKLHGLRPATLLKKRLWHRCFLVNFVKFCEINICCC